MQCNFWEVADETFCTFQVISLNCGKVKTGLVVCHIIKIIYVYIINGPALEVTKKD